MPSFPKLANFDIAVVLATQNREQGYVSKSIMQSLGNIIKVTTYTSKKLPCNMIGWFDNPLPTQLQQKSLKKESKIHQIKLNM